MHTPGTAHPRRWWILAALCLSLLVLVIDNTILNLAIPSLMSELGASPQDIQWIISSYTLAFAGLLLTAGALADRYGRKRMLISGLTVFAVASLLASMTTAPGVLVAARALMGVGGSLVMPTTMSILVNVPVAAVAIAAAAWLMPESTGAAGRTDVVGAVLCTVGMVAVVYAITAASEHGWGGLVPTGVLVSGLVVMAAFVVWELRTPAPMLPLRIFRDRNFTGGTFSVMLLAFAAAGMMLALTQYVQLVAGYGVLRAGLALLPFAAASAAFNMAGATLGRRFGNRAMVTTGMLITGDPQLLAAARAAFTGSMSVGMAIGAALSTAAAVLAFSLLRAKPAAVQAAEPASVRARETI